MSPRPPWREPMLWLVAGIPLATLVAGFATLFLAGGDGSTDAAPEPVRRTAQVQQADVGADAQAARAGLRAVLRFDPATGAIVGRVLPAPATGELRLRFVHPAIAAADRSVQLRPRGNAWVGALPPLAVADWRLQLSPGNDAWRLVGRWHPAAAQAELRPALVSP